MGGLRQGWHPDSRFVDLDGWTAHYVEAGQGQPVLLLHGILVSSWAWRFNLNPLSQHFRVLALCQKGHGWSDKHADPYTLGSLADFVLRFLDRMKIDQVDLVGNSLGGAVSLTLALEHPDRVRKLVLVDSAAVPLRVINPLLAIQSPFLIPAYKVAGRPFVFKVLLRALAYRNIPIDTNYMRGFMAPLRQRGAIAAAAHIARNLPPGLRDLFPRLGGMTRPVQLIWGAHDRLLPLRSGLLLNRILPTSRLEVFSHCAHCPMEEDPPRFNRIVTEFLSERVDQSLC